MKFFVDVNIPLRTARRVLRLHPGSIYAMDDSRFREMDEEEIY